MSDFYFILCSYFRSCEGLYSSAQPAKKSSEIGLRNSLCSNSFGLQIYESSVKMNCGRPNFVFFLSKFIFFTIIVITFRKFYNHFSRIRLQSWNPGILESVCSLSRNQDDVFQNLVAVYCRK